MPDWTLKTLVLVALAACFAHIYLTARQLVQARWDRRLHKRHVSSMELGRYWATLAALITLAGAIVMIGFFTEWETTDTPNPEQPHQQ